MNKKEISELSRRFKLEKSNISKIYGCYVNSNKEVISYLAPAKLDLNSFVRTMWFTVF